jgi:nucleoside-diphosphate-sugar epimerase
MDMKKIHKVLVTGGGGYIGGYLCNFLAEKGFHVIAVDIARQRYLKKHPQIEFHRVDIRDKDALDPLFQDVDAVFHLAFVQTDSHKIPLNVLRDIDIGGTRNVLELAVRYGVKKFIHTSSIEVYGAHPISPITESADKPLNDPLNLYSLLKAEAEMLAWDYSREHHLPMVSLRFPMVCGEGFYNYKVFMKMMDNLRKNRIVFMVGNGKNRFNQVYLYDVLESYYLAYSTDTAVGKAFNICSDDSVTVDQMLRYGKEVYASTSKIIYFPVSFVQYILRVLLFFGVYVIYPSDLEWLRRDIVFDNSKAKRVLGFKPTKTTKECMKILVDSFSKSKTGILDRDTDTPFMIR